MRSSRRTAAAAAAMNRRADVVQKETAAEATLYTGCLNARSVHDTAPVADVPYSTRACIYCRKCMRVGPPLRVHSVAFYA